MHTHSRTSRARFSMLVVQTVVAPALMLFVASAARAESTPVGTLPDGTVSTVNTQRGALVAVALPRPKPSTGLVWRLARNVDSKIVRQADEVESASSVVVVFRVVGRGTASIVFALTRGESSPKALRAHTTKIISRAAR
jgi:hypothetical protein